MILVTGANGQLGRRIVQHLIAREPALRGRRLAVSVREPARAGDLALRNVLVRHGDFDQPDTLPQAFAGALRLVLVPTDGPAALRLQRHGNAIRAAVAAGVGHVLYVSGLEADMTPATPFSRVHQETEALLAESKLPHTVLRCPPYADALPGWFAPALADGTLRVPAGEGALSLVSRDELAQAIAAAALAPRLDQRIHRLTGQAALGLGDIAARIARVCGRPLRYEAGKAANTTEATEATASLFAAIARGQFAALSRDFAALVGHPPKSLDCLIHEYFAPRSLA